MCLYLECSPVLKPNCPKLFLFCGTFLNRIDHPEPPLYQVDTLMLTLNTPYCNYLFPCLSPLLDYELLESRALVCFVFMKSAYLIGKLTFSRNCMNEKDSQEKYPRHFSVVSSRTSDVPPCFWKGRNKASSTLDITKTGKFWSWGHVTRNTAFDTEWSGEDFVGSSSRLFSYLGIWG